MSKTWKRFLSLMLALTMIVSAPIAVFAENADPEENPRQELDWQVIENNPEKLAQAVATDDLEEEEPEETLTGDVRVSIVLEKPSTIEAGYATQKIGQNADAMAYRKKLEDEQDSIAATISKKALGGKELDVVWNITLAGNIISANVPAEKIEAIKAIDGVKDVVVEMQYEPQVVEKGGEDPNMTISSDMTAAQIAWAAGYTGAGSIVAIVDTGLDIEHQSFNATAFDFSIAKIENETGRKFDLLTEDEVEAVWDNLNAAQRYDSVDGVYRTSKIPYAFNYVDKSLYVEHTEDRQGEHGSHVAGISAANRYIYSEDPDTGDVTLQNAYNSVKMVGNAPDAQVLVMKVFGQGGGAYDSDYMVAVEDAIMLGADAVNLSLGSSVAGFSNNSTYQELLDKLAEKDNTLVWCNSAGNSYEFPYFANNIGYLYSDDANYATGGSPGTYTNTMSVASVENDGASGPYLTYQDEPIFYTQTSGYGNEPFVTIAGDHEWVYIDAPGTDEEFAQVKDLLEGKIAICNRGSTSFFEKANAAVANGALGVIIVNNQPGTISMNLTGYEYSAPVVSVTQAVGNTLKSTTDAQKTEGGLTYYTGTLTVGDQIGAVNNKSDYYLMSDFSSWGVPGNLTLKPEITTPGGNIWSLNGYHLPEQGDGFEGGHDAYELMSGTSMASPQLAGIVALIKQYIREEGLEEKAEELGISTRALTQSLLMSTAVPLIEEDSGNYYSVLKQGAGLADVEAAINSSIAILMKGTEVDGEVRKDMTTVAADGKVKAELGDDPERAGKYAIEYTLNNLTDEEQIFNLNGDFFTQDIFAYGEDTYLDTWTAPLQANIKWYIDGLEYSPEGITYTYNFDEDEAGIFNEQDAQAILDYVVGTRETLGDIEEADLNGNGEIDTNDAYLALRLTNEAETIVPANGSIEIRAEIELTDIDDFDDNGAYIEGYLYVSELDSEDGAEGVVHTIPVLGYYGSWSEPSMVDVGSRLQFNYGLETRTPYVTSKTTQGFQVTYAGTNSRTYFGGNPVVADQEYKPERNAISADTTISRVTFTRIRNSIAHLFQVTDEEGNVYTQTQGGSGYAAYYNQTSGRWATTSANVTFNYKPTDIPDGTKVTLELDLAPEYYQNADGSIRWDELADGARLTIPAVVDNTAPVLSHVYAERTEEGAVITVEASDNEYISSFQIWDETNWNSSRGRALQTVGATQEDKEGENDEEEYSYVLPATTADHLIMVVYDYAMNATTVQVNLNKEELEENMTITISQEEAQIMAGNTLALTAEVGPWGAEQNVLWSSDNEEVATVDENGIVTGLESGVAVITAAVAAKPEVSATCTVTVVKMDKDLNGIVWDEEGDVWYSAFNLSTLPNYEKLNDESIRMEMTGLTYDENGTLYGVTFDSEEWTSGVYTIDPATWEATEVGQSEFGYMDICAAPSLNDNHLLAVYGPYVLIIDKTTAQYEGAFDLSSFIGDHYLVGIAYEEQFEHPTYGNTDWVWLLDDGGNVYQTGFLPYEDNYSRFNVTSIGQIGKEVDTSYFQSLYYDGLNLYWSRYDSGENDVDIVVVSDVYEDGSVYEVGSFADNVWPVGGLFELGVNPATGFGEKAADHSDAVVDANAVMADEITPVSFNAAASKGSLNAFRGTPSVSRKALNLVEAEDGTTAEITIEADALHNGLYVTEYDAEVLELVDVKTNLKYTANKPEEGKVTFGFISDEDIEAGSTVATLTFKIKTNDMTTVTVKTVEADEAKPEDKTAAYIINENKPVESITVDPAEATIAIEETLQLTAVIAPEDATNQNVTWTSSDDAIASVDENGVVTGLKVGKATITATTEDGAFTAAAEITVLFKDVMDSSKYYFTPIYWAVENEITKGYMTPGEDKYGTFGVDEDCTRGALMVFLWRMAGKPSVSGISNPFNDVDKATLGSTYYNAILWGVSQGITKGYTDGGFHPNASTTRKDIMIMLYRFAGKPAFEEKLPVTFTDVAGVYKTTSDSYKAISWGYNMGITKGYSSGEYAGQFGCQLNCNRQDIVTFLYRYDKLD